MSFALIQPVTSAKINEAFGGIGGPHKLQYPVGNFIESVMFWMNELVRIHKMNWCENDEIDESDVLNEQGFKWYRYNPNKEEFTPEDNGENLIGYPWNVQEFWIDFNKKIDFIQYRTRIFNGTANSQELPPFNQDASSGYSYWLYKQYGLELIGQYAKLKRDEYRQFIPFAVTDRPNFTSFLFIKDGSSGRSGPMTEILKQQINDDAYNRYLTSGFESSLSGTTGKAILSKHITFDQDNSGLYYTVTYRSSYLISYRLLSHNKNIPFSLRNFFGNTSNIFTTNFIKNITYDNSVNYKSSLIYGYLNLDFNSSGVDFVNNFSTFKSILITRIYNKIIAGDYTTIVDELPENESDFEYNFDSIFEETPSIDISSSTNPDNAYKIIFFAIIPKGGIIMSQVTDSKIADITTDYQDNIGLSQAISTDISGDVGDFLEANIVGSSQQGFPGSQTVYFKIPLVDTLYESGGLM